VIPLGTAVLLGRMEPHDNARSSTNRPDLADDRRRTEHLAVVLEPRTEIGDLNRSAFIIVEARDEYRCVFEVMLFASHRADELDGEHSTLVREPLTVEQRTKHRIAVEPREAAPDDARLGVDECANRTVSHQREIERAHCSHGPYR